MKKLELRRQRLSDAKRFYEILSNPNFIYFYAKPKSIKEEEKFLKANAQKKMMNLEHNFTITYDGKIIGACGIKMISSRAFTGEIGYFIDEEYWGRGLTMRAVKLLEKFGAKELGLKRFEIAPMKKNKASIRVAEKCGYKREGTLKKALMSRLGKREDAYMLAKVK